MSMDFNTMLAIGFKWSRQEVIDQIGKITEPITEMRKRFDQNTGEELEPVERIVKHGSTEYAFDGKLHDGLHELSSYITENLGLYSEVGGDFSTGEDEHLFVGLKPGKDAVRKNYGRFSFSYKDFPLASIPNLMPTLNEIVNKLNAAGLQPGDPVVTLVWYAG